MDKVLYYHPPIKKGEFIKKPYSSSKAKRANRKKPNQQKRTEKSSESSEQTLEFEGVIIAVLAGTMFRVKIGENHVVLAHVSGKMRKRFIRLVVGDKVKLEVSPYDLTKARIVYRAR